MSKEIFKDMEALKEMKIGIDAVADLVIATLGPKGGNVVIEQEGGKPLFTKDGKTSGCAMSLPNPIQNMGCDIAKNVLERADTESKGSRSTALVLFHAFVTKAMEDMSSNDILSEQAIQICDLLERNSNKITKEEQLIQLATISSGSEKIGSIVGNAVYTMGTQAALTVEESKNPGINIIIEDGMHIESGYVQSDQEEIVMKNVTVYISNELITGRIASEIVSTSFQSGISEIVIFSDDFTQEAIDLLDVNHLNNSLHSVCIRIPGYGELKKEIRKDIITIAPSGLKVQKIIVKRDETIIFNPKDTDVVKQHLINLRIALKKEDDEYEKEKLSQRIANLDSGIGVIYIGGYSDSALKVVIQKTQDAINESKSALEYGFIKGAGAALLDASHINSALMAPNKHILENGAILPKNVIEAGIIDSLKTIQNAVLFAAHEAEVFLCTKRSVVHIPKND